MRRRSSEAAFPRGRLAAPDVPATEPGEPIELQTSARWGDRPGVLTITNRRVVFSQLQGVVRKRERTHWSAPLEALTSIRSDPAGTLVLVRRSGRTHGPHQVTIALDDAPAAARLLRELQAASQAHGHASERTGGASHAASGPAMVMFRCPYCRTVYPELDARCPSCGAPF